MYLHESMSVFIMSPSYPRAGDPRQKDGKRSASEAAFYGFHGLQRSFRAAQSVGDDYTVVWILENWGSSTDILGLANTVTLNKTVQVPAFVKLAPSEGRGEDDHKPISNIQMLLEVFRAMKKIKQDDKLEQGWDAKISSQVQPAARFADEVCLAFSHAHSLQIA